MCTPQFQQAIAGAQAAGYIPGKQISQEEAMASAQAGAAMGQPQFDTQQLMASGQLGAGMGSGIGATARQISELFDPRTGQRIRQVGPPMDMPMVPITKEEFDGPIVSDSIQSIPRHMMRKELSPMPIKRQPTVGELLGIPPGSVQEVGGPGRF
jgi:hypothetical protein